MADSTVSNLPRANTASSTDLLILDQSSTTKSITVADLSYAFVYTGLTATFASPPPIGITAPNSGAFTSLGFTGALTGGTAAWNIGAGQLVKDTAGNIGIGVTPSVPSIGKNFEVGYRANGIWGAANSNMLLTAGIYYNSGYIYASGSTPSSYYQQVNGAHYWKSAPGGTVDTAATMNAGMMLDLTGNLTVTAGLKNTPATVANGNVIEATSGPGASSLGNRNKLINGAFDVWQWGTSANPAANTLTFLADLWTLYSNSDNSKTFSQQAGFLGAKYCMRVQRNAASTSTNVADLGQIIESAIVQRLAGKTVTVSFDVRAGANFSGASSQMQYGLLTGTAADQGFAASNSGWTGAAWTVGPNAALTISTTATRYSFSFTMPANALEAKLRFSWQPTGTAGAADYFEITNIQMEEGAATPFESRPYALELDLCSRFGQRFAYLGSNVALAGYVQTASVGYLDVPTKPFRATPTAVFTGAGTPNVFYSAGSTTAITGIGTIYGSPDRSGMTVQFTTAAVMTPTTPTQFYANGGAVNLDFHAELI